MHSCIYARIIMQNKDKNKGDSRCLTISLFLDFRVQKFENY